MGNYSKKLYNVSGLTYTLPRLLVTMGLIFLGYGCLCMCVSQTPTLVTLKLKELGISSTLLIFITTTIGQFFNMTVCPWVSFKSDRYRSERWGRRVPFILYTLPFMCLSWLIIGFFDEESWLLNKIISPMIKLSPETWAIIVISVGIIIFKFFYMFVGSVFYYIYNDVIPPQMMTRFTGGITIVGSLFASVYNFFIFPHSMDHFKWVMIGFAVIYTVLMGAVCFFLKEPRFPDPEPEQKKKGKGLAGLFAFGKECFSHRIYIYEFIQTALVMAAVSSSIFVVFHQQSMGLTLGDIGNMNGIFNICRTIMAFAAASVGAIFIDRWHPVRISVFLGAFVFLVPCYDTRWFFFDPPAEIFWWVNLFSMIFVIVTLFTDIAGMPTLQMILPKSRFGQFCSAKSLVASLTGMVFGLLMGVYMDTLKIGFSFGDRAFRGIFFWQVFFHGGALVFSMMKFYQYRKLGGFSAYKAPAIWQTSGQEIMEVSKTAPPSIKWVKFILRSIDILFVISVISPIAMICLLNVWNIGKGQIFYLSANLPVSVVILVFWLILRKKITGNIQIIMDGGRASIPHHGILLLAVIMRFLFQGVFVMEAVMLMQKSCSGNIAAKLNLYESSLDIVFLALIWLCTALEEKIDKAEQ